MKPIEPVASEISKNEAFHSRKDLPVRTNTKNPISAEYPTYNIAPVIPPNEMRVTQNHNAMMNT